MRRVVVTGVGAVSPVGLTAASSWDAVCRGESGVDQITLFDTSAFASTIAGECTGFDPLTLIEKKKMRECARFVQFAISASHDAITSAGFEPDDAARDRVGTFIGVGFCGLEVVEATHERLRTKGPRRVSPYFIPSAISNMAPGQVSMRWGLRGPSLTTVSACSSGAHAVGDAFKWIQRGAIDAAIAGGAEACLTPLGVGGFAAMRALSKRNDDPKAASRPFDTGRDGFVMGEGAGIMVLEERESAIKRGAPIVCEIVGYGASADAYHLTQPAPEGEGAQRAMRAALRDAQLTPSAVKYINAHGTSTPTGDGQELLAIKGVFGAGAKDVLISSTKSMTGHLLGAAGGLEAVFAAQSIQNKMAPATRNLENLDEAAEGLDLVRGEARQADIDVALTNSFGFGGTNVSLIFQAHS